MSHGPATSIRSTLEKIGTPTRIVFMVTSDDDRFVNRLVLPEPFDRQRRAVERPVFAEHQHFREREAGGRRLHRAVSGEAGGEDEIAVVRMLAEDGVVIDGVRVVET